MKKTNTVINSNVEEVPAREFKRTLPDVRSAFHVMNWKTILIARIVDSVYTAAEVD